MSRASLGRRLTPFTPNTEATATGYVIQVHGYVSYLALRGTAAADQTVLLVDAATAVSTPVKMELAALAGDLTPSITFNPPIRMATGIRLVIAGTTPKVYIGYTTE